MRSFVKRDQFTVLPMPDEVIGILDAMAAKDGITRATNLFVDENGLPEPDYVKDLPPHLVIDSESDDEDDIRPSTGPTIKAIPDDKRSEGVSDVDIEDVDKDDNVDVAETEPEVPNETDLRANEERSGKSVPEP
jgi:hypothetical protein